MNYKKKNQSYKNKLFSKLALMLAVAIIMQSFMFVNNAHGQVTSDLTATIYSNISVQLSWYDYMDNEKSYTIERKVDSGAYEVLRTVSANNVSAYDNSVSKSHTYTYRVWVTDSNDNKYLYTQEVTLQTDEIDRPDSLTITPISDTQLDIKWTYEDQKAYTTVIERREEGSTTWTRIASVGAGLNTYSDKTITAGTRYYYKVRVYNTENVRFLAYPDETYGNGTYSLLYKPTDLDGFALYQNQIKITWKDNSLETAFVIERKSPDDGVFKELAVVPANITFYIDSNNLKPNLTYTYRIKAVTGDASYEYSDPLSVVNTYLRTPGTLSSSCVDGKSIKLTWQDLTDNETGFEIWRKSGSDSDWVKYDYMGRNATTFTDLYVSPQDIYSYKVRAKINDNSIYSNFSNETTIGAYTIAAPSDLSYEVVGKTEIKLTWKDTSAVETGLKVEKKIGYSGDWYVISELDPDVTTFNDKWMNDTDIYFYRIKVIDRSNSVNYSDELMVSLKIPEAPTDLEADPVSASEIQLSWKDNSYNESEFVIEAMQFSNFKEIGRVRRDTTNFVYSNISPDETITFRVRAVTGSSQSNPSNTVVATTNLNSIYPDISGVQWAVKAINNLAGRNVFDTKKGSKFYPNQNITRGEYCAIIIRSLNLKMVSAGRFADVTSKTRYYKEIMAASKLGIISADKNNKIYPNNLITREQAAIMLTLALKMKGTPLPAQNGSTLKQFADNKSVPAASADEFAAVCGAGIFSGISVNGITYLKPKGYVTRAEASVIAYKAINIK